MKNLKNAFLLFASLYAVPTLTIAAEPLTSVPMDEAHWKVVGEKAKFEKHLGVQSLFLPAGYAELMDVVFHNGIIEFDISFPQGRGFPGIGFRVQDNGNYEELYVRPHQSGNPDANQYTPIFNGLAGWQLYHGDGHGAAVTYKYDAWNHVKLVIRGTHGEVFINDMEKPLFQIHDLKLGDTKGPIGLKGDANAHFANFSYSLEENPELKLPLKASQPLKAEVIDSYQVAGAIPDADIQGKSHLNLSGLSWKEMATESTGTLNIAKGVKRGKDKNTALVKIQIDSRSAQIKKLEFGYSDVAHVYVNNKIVYSGQRKFRSRDYRYLGTIGYFDAVYLDLKEGQNEVIIAVTEAFGGWGIKARFENLNGIDVN